jgi:hypothetical protein
MNIFELIAQHAKAAGLDFLLIGGYAVIGHGYPRFTADVDLLIEEKQIAAWYGWLSSLGYVIYYQHPNFLQLRAPRDLPPVDLMLVDAETFSKLNAGAVQVLAGGAELPEPKVEHIVALKLHAIQSRPRDKVEKDWLDVFQLIKQHGLALDAPEFRAIVEKYGGQAAIERIRETLGE